MNFMKVIWRLVLCALFVIGLAYGFSAQATEPEGQEKALHETHEATEIIEHEEGKAAEKAHEPEAQAEAYSEGEQETHETEGEPAH
jgi:hypothetical protein